MQRQIPKPGQASDAEKLLLGAATFEGFIRKIGLKEYYGADLKQIPRAEKFMSWLKKEGKQLLESLKSDLSAGMIKLNPKSEKERAFVLGVWLGSKYVASTQGYPVSKPTFPIVPDVDLKNEIGVLAFDAQDKTIKVHPGFLARFQKVTSKTVEVFIAGLNSTIHEGTHGLNALLGRKGQLSELGAFFMHTTLALPLKSDEAGKNFSFPLATRYFPQIIDEIRNGRLKVPLEVMKAEYLDFAVGPWLANVLGKNPDLKQFTIQSPLPLPLEVIYNNLAGLTQTPEARGDFLELFKEATGLKNIEAEAKFMYAFSLIADMDNRTFPKFISNFVQAMDKAFGKPTNPGIPKTYVSLDRLVPVKTG